MKTLVALAFVTLFPITAQYAAAQDGGTGISADFEALDWPEIELVHISRLAGASHVEHLSGFVDTTDGERYLFVGGCAEETDLSEMRCTVNYFGAVMDLGFPFALYDGDRGSWAELESLGRTSLQARNVEALDLRGPAGPQGERGLTGPIGPQGPAGTSNSDPVDTDPEDSSDPSGRSDCRLYSFLKHSEFDNYAEMTVVDGDTNAWVDFGFTFRGKKYVEVGRLNSQGEDIWKIYLALADRDIPAGDYTSEVIDFYCTNE